MFGHNALQGHNINTLCKSLIEEDPHVFKQFSPVNIFGTFIKFNSEFCHGVHPKTGEKLIYERHNVEPRVFDLVGITDENGIDMITSKTWQSTHPQSIVDFVQQEEPVQETIGA
jgi:hypothetical protein